MIIVGPAIATHCGQIKLKDISTYDKEVLVVPAGDEADIAEIKRKLRATTVDVYFLGTSDSIEFKSNYSLIESIDKYFQANSPTPLTL